MFTNSKLRLFFVLFFIIGLIPIYNLLVVNIEGANAIHDFQVWVVRHFVGGFTAAFSTFLYLRVTSNDTDPTWVTIIGTISIFLFCTYCSSLLTALGVPFVLSSMLFGLGFGIQFYELDITGSIPIGLILWGSSILGALSFMVFI